MKKRKFFTLLASLYLFGGCADLGNKHFISDPELRQKVKSDYQSRVKAVGKAELFATNEKLTLEEQEALEFLLAYMPIGDITDYGTEYFVAQVRQALQMKQQVGWGDSIPETVFRHFVLPVRSNNETLDDFRTTYGDTLLNRVKGLSLKDAALAVNHWCHEKVVYTSTDARTFGPMAAMKNAGGRCGEESVFAVSALRAVGIPARQVYSPRWAHTDDNHAWVEVFVENKWQFMGACEPEPVLNLGWFNGPASRGMLMLTNAFGASYDGPEEVVSVTPNYTELNVMYTYGPVAKVDFRVKDAQGNAVEGAELEFKIFNYAEYNTVARKTTDAKGESALNAGLGDMLVWATKGDRFGYSKVSFGEDKLIEIVLDKQNGDAITEAIDLVPPVEGAVLPEVTEEMRKANNELLVREDAVRNAYTATFCSEEQARKIAEELDIDSEKCVRILTTARSNHGEITAFLRETTPQQRPLAVALLETVSTKDLRDVPGAVFASHLRDSENKNESLFVRYVLNPRVDREFLTAYKGILRSETDPAFVSNAQNNPELLVEWVRREIRVDNTLNHQKIAMQPLGVWKARVTDDKSRDRFFVAYARALGIPARVEPVNRKVQYFAGESWKDVNFTDEVRPESAQQGELKLTYKPSKAVNDPGYYKHFTIAKVNGTKLQTLDFESNSNVDMGGGSALSNLMKKPLLLDEGNYILATGSRQGDGSVLSKIASFEIRGNQKTSLELEMREDMEALKVLGKLNGQQTYSPLTACTSIDLKSVTNGEAYIVAILGVKQEPTNHAMRDIAEFSKEFEQWGGKQVLLFPNREDYSRFDAKEFKGLPNTIVYGLDSESSVTKALVENGGLMNSSLLPIVAIVNKKGEIVFLSQGYTIGLGAQMLKIIHKL